MSPIMLNKIGMGKEDINLKQTKYEDNKIHSEIIIAKNGIIKTIQYE